MTELRPTSLPVPAVVGMQMQRASRAPVVMHVELGEFQFGLFGQKPAGFADIQGASSTEGNDRIALGFAKGFGCLHHVLFDGIGVDAMKKLPCLAEL